MELCGYFYTINWPKNEVELALVPPPAIKSFFVLLPMGRPASNILFFHGQTVNV